VKRQGWLAEDKTHNFLQILNRLSTILLSGQKFSANNLELRRANIYIYMHMLLDDEYRRYSLISHY
jgi:hypothetical protein